MKRIPAILAAAFGLLLAGPALVGAPVLAHAQLVASDPGNSKALETSPEELRLVFSEPLETRYTGLDVLDADGATLVANIGAPNPANHYEMVAEPEPLPDGGYLIVWRALSAADGHTTTGFFTFGVNDVPLNHNPEDPTNVAGHNMLLAGHEVWPGIANPLEIASRVVNYLGFFIGFGLLPIGWFVLRPAFGRIPRRALTAQAVFLFIGTLGALGLAAVVANRAQLPLPDYLQSSRTGQLLVWRLAAGAIGLVAVIVLARLGRPVAALVAGGIGAGVGLVFLALGGHASAFASPSPMAAMLVHLFAAAIWVTGLVVLFVLAFKRERPPMSSVIPRFSALALLAIALLSATGIYADWAQTRDIFSLETSYNVTLAIKIGIVVAALAIGGLNFLDGGAERRWFGGFRVRIGAEVLLAMLILVVTGNLGSGFPPASERPVPIQRAVSSAVIANAPNLEFEVAPAKPGPNRIVMTIDPAPPDGSVVRADLTPLNLDLGLNQVFLSKVITDASGRTYEADGLLMPPGSTWNAEARVFVPEDADPNDDLPPVNIEVAHNRYEFGFDQVALSSGKAVPPIDPGFIVGLLLLCAGVLGGIYAMAGGSLPRVEHATGRIALAGGGVIGSTVGLILVAFGAQL